MKRVSLVGCEQTTKRRAYQKALKPSPACVGQATLIGFTNMKYLKMLLLLALAPSFAHAGTLSGTVVDPAGAVIPNAQVVVRWDSLGLDDVKDNLGTTDIKTAATDTTGHFSVTLPPGVYDIFVSADGFSPRCEKITITAKAEVNFVARLAVSRKTITIKVN
jgi:hypothetical protein